MEDSFVNNIFRLPAFHEGTAIQLFQYQFQHNKVYNEWCRLLSIQPHSVTCLEQIPFMPISFFKTHRVITGEFNPEVTFTSSGTTQSVSSRHLVKDASLYKASFMAAFRRFYGDVKNWCIIGLLPSYLERDGSSLVYMVKELIEQSAHPQSGFYLHDWEALHQTLQKVETQNQKTLLIGVTYALLDFAAEYPLPLQHTVVMDTGGMKGKKKEITREEVHGELAKAFHLKNIHSEYGMTELLSQAYSAGNGMYRCPPWMKVLVRNEEDPLHVSHGGKGVLNIIDLANRDSCAFIATDDAGIVHQNESFEVWGRLDNSDIRGCSLLSL